jgi:magnesium transporter
MTSDSEALPWRALEEIAARGDAESLAAEVELMGPRESARAISRLRPESQERILTLLDPEKAAELFQEISNVQAVEFIAQLPPEQAAPILDAMESDDTADILSQLPGDHAEEILGVMDPGNAAEARKLVSYDPHEAGGLMITEFLAYPSALTAQEVIDDMRRNSEKYSEYSIQYSFVVSGDGRLDGVLPLRDLLLMPAHRRIDSFMIRNPLCVHDHATLEELEEFFDHHAFLGVPVCDEADRLVGVVRRGDVEEALGDRAKSDYLKTQGIIGGDELRSMPTLTRSGRRLSWLSVNIVLNILAASVIAFFQDTLSAVIALAVFLPIISDMSGCSGSQAVAVSMRELSLGLVKPFEIVHVLIKEVSVGCINGVALGMLIALVGWGWQGNPWLGLVIGAAMCVNTVIAVSIGGTVPLVLKRLKRDPALASGPILTTITDMCGFFLVLGLATLFLPYLTAV